MANHEHIKWLLEGVDKWNARREQQDFDPDFVGANIYEEFQQSQKINKDGHIPPTLEVSKDHKRQILGELRLLNVTRETLYPGLDEAAKAVTQHHSN